MRKLVIVLRQELGQDLRILVFLLKVSAVSAIVAVPLALIFHFLR